MDDQNQTSVSNFNPMIIKILTIIFNILFLASLNLPWMRANDLTVESGEFLVYFNDLGASSIVAILLIIPIILILVSIISIGSKLFRRNTNVIVFFISLTLSILMIMIMYDLWNRWILSWEQMPIDLRRLEVSFEYGIQISMISTLVMTIFAFISIKLDKQNIGFLNWTIQKKIFIIILFINILLVEPMDPYSNITVFFYIMIFALLFADVVDSDFRITLLLLFTILSAFTSLTLYFYYVQVMLFVSFALNCIMIGILAWSKVNYVDILDYDYDLESKPTTAPPRDGLKLTNIFPKPKPDPAPKQAIPPPEQPKPIINDIPKSPKPPKQPALNKDENIEHYSHIFNINPERATDLYNSGYKTMDDFKDAIPEDLILIDGINPTLARRIIRITKTINE